MLVSAVSHNTSYSVMAFLVLSLKRLNSSTVLFRKTAIFIYIQTGRTNNKSKHLVLKDHGVKINRQNNENCAVQFAIST